MNLVCKPPIDGYMLSLTNEESFVVRTTTITFWRCDGIIIILQWYSLLAKKCEIFQTWCASFELASIRVGERFEEVQRSHCPDIAKFMTEVTARDIPPYFIFLTPLTELKDPLLHVEFGRFRMMERYI